MTSYYLQIPAPWEVSYHSVQGDCRIAEQTRRLGHLSPIEDIMNLRDKFHQQIASVASNRAAISDLYAWMSRHMQTLASAADPNLAELDGEVWQLLTEY